MVFSYIFFYYKLVVVIKVKKILNNFDLAHAKILDFTSLISFLYVF